MWDVPPSSCTFSSVILLHIHSIRKWRPVVFGREAISSRVRPPSSVSLFLLLRNWESRSWPIVQLLQLGGLNVAALSHTQLGERERRRGCEKLDGCNCCSTEDRKLLTKSDRDSGAAAAESGRPGGHTHTQPDTNRMSMRFFMLFFSSS